MFKLIFCIFTLYFNQKGLFYKKIIFQQVKPSMANSRISILLITVLCNMLFFSCKKNNDCTPAATANAGLDQVVTDVTVTLAANAPATGKGIWSIVSGANGAFADMNNPTSTFTGTAGTVYVLRWTISGCPSSQDDVQITLNICTAPTQANAGVDESSPVPGLTLSANTPTSGTGIWSIVSGTGGNFSNVNSPTSAFTGVTGTTYVLRWTISGCPAASQDDVQIIFNDNPVVSFIDKTSVINGEIITLNGYNFHVNYQGNSQIIIRKSGTADNYLTILSVTPTELKFVMQNPLAYGTFDLIYFKRETSATSGVEWPTSTQVTLNPPGATQFYTGTLASSSTAKGSNQTAGVKNGSATASDYAVKLIHYDYTTGTSQEYVAPVVSITANGFSGGTMDALVFTVPASTPPGSYYCEVIYQTNTILMTLQNQFTVF